MCKKVMIETLTKEIQELKRELRCKEKILQELVHQEQIKSDNGSLTPNEISRYSRQMIMPQVTINGQLALKKSNVLVVGTGGLGCPALLYLAAAGVGHITLLDYDDVEVTNLHRQILHTEFDTGIPKVQSAASKLKSINSTININPLKLHASAKTISDVISGQNYDVVIDGTDNVASRYLLNDVCIMNSIPLVSGSALQMEGQLTVYGYNGGPCYRCLFPIPPPPHTVTNCGDGGVLGPIPGTIGVLQALEAIKIITKMEGVLSGRLLIFDGTNTTFRNVKIRNRNKNCSVCGESPEIKSLIDYEQFCGAKAHDKVENINILLDNEMVSVEDYSRLDSDNLVIDVRPELEYQMCSLPNTVNTPLSKIEAHKATEEVKDLILNKYKTSTIYLLCRRGNDSQRAVHFLREALADLPVRFINIRGGLHAYAKYVDPSFPVY